MEDLNEMDKTLKESEIVKVEGGYTFSHILSVCGSYENVPQCLLFKTKEECEKTRDRILNNEPLINLDDASTVLQQEVESDFHNDVSSDSTSGGDSSEPEYGSSQNSDIDNKNESVIEDLTYSDYLYAIVAGLISGVLFSFFWSLFTSMTEYKWTLLGALAGVAVGFSVRYMCKRVTTAIAVISGLCAVLSCVIGDFFISVAFIAQHEGISNIEILQKIDYSYFFEITFLTFDGFSLLVYVIAAITSYSICKS